MGPFLKLSYDGAMYYPVFDYAVELVHRASELFRRATLSVNTLSLFYSYSISLLLAETITTMTPNIIDYLLRNSGGSFLFVLGHQFGLNLR